MELSPFYQELLTSLNRGLLVSIALIIPSAVGGVLLGILAGAVRTFGNPLVRRTADAYAAIFRGTPLVVQLFVLYFGLPNIGIYLSPYVAAVVGFTLCSGAYQSEYIRGALLSIKEGNTSGPKRSVLQVSRLFSGSLYLRRYAGPSTAAVMRLST